MQRALTRVPLVLVAVLSGGCSISWSLSESSESVSDSLASVSGSSSPKEGIGEAKIPYRDDVANLTMSVVASNFSSSNFMDALNRIAAQRRISSWASEKATYYGIGKGLKKAGVSKSNIPRQTFLQGVLSSRAEALQWIQSGYRY
ncbi:MAG: putative lipoprotein [Methylotetracoccus sp.]|jgi:hypothetical protein|nr:putative lipoprotein [Methylotetracoccus sp.]